MHNGEIHQLTRPIKLFKGLLSSVRDWVDPRAIVRQEELSRWKILKTPPGIEPPTFQIVAQHKDKVSCITCHERHNRE